MYFIVSKCAELRLKIKFNIYFMANDNFKLNCYFISCKFEIHQTNFHDHVSALTNNSFWLSLQEANSSLLQNS